MKAWFIYVSLLVIVALFAAFSPLGDIPVRVNRRGVAFTLGGIMILFVIINYRFVCLEERVVRLEKRDGER